MPFETKYCCSDCGNDFSVVSDNRPRGRCPACPNCKKGKYPHITSISKSNKIYTQEELDKNHREIVESRKAPSVGGSNFTKAMDATAEIVMQDYGMTNLQDNLRAGDSMAPKLAPELERKVDNVFKPQRSVAGAQASSALNNTMIRQINSGIYKGFGGANDVVARQQNSGIRPNTNIIHSYDGGKSG